MKNGRLCVTVLFVAVLSAACSEGTRLSPSAPSAIPTPVVASTSDSPAVDRSSVTADSRAVDQWAAEHGWSANDLEVEGADVITGVTGTCPAVVMTVRGVPVSVTSATEFRSGNCAALAPGVRVHVRGVLTLVGGQLSVRATRIAFEDDPGNREVEIAGRVATVTGMCPALTITLQGMTGTILTNASTVFDGSCARIAVGTKVEAKGMFDPVARQLVARRIEIEEDRREVEVEGTVATVSGVCPALTITLRGIAGTILTNAATQFDNGACARIGMGTRIEARGMFNETTRQLVASRIEIEDQGTRRRNGEGSVGNLRGVCPTLMFSLHGVPVRTTPATVFQNGACTALREGSKVFVEGDEGLDGVITATLVRVIEQPGRQRREGEGRVSSVMGTCPALTMIVAGFTVVTSMSTEFKDGRCTNIRPGVHLEVRGEWDGRTLFADRVKFEDDDDDDARR